MGNRALVILKDSYGYSPVCYVHWMGSQVEEVLAELKEFMADRKNDKDYGFARLVGHFHDRSRDSNLSLGCWNLPADFEEKEAYLRHMSHGDAGVFIVDTKDYSYYRVY